MISSVLPAVAHNYIVIDVANASNAESDNATAWFVDPVEGDGSAEERVTRGAGDVYRMSVSSFWIPTPTDPAVLALNEYWLCWNAPGVQYRSHASAETPAVFPMEVETTDDHRTKLTPVQGSVTMTEPREIRAGRLSIASPAADLSMRRVRYTAAVVFDGTTAVFALGAGHGVAAGDTIHPYSRGNAITLNSAFRRINPHGGVVASADATSVTVPCAGAASLTETIQVVVGSRWIRIPVTVCGLAVGVTNYTAP